ncbi:MAG: cyclic beta 1-2 glucan synthetase [Chitinophagaceae bacterium]|nr:cyclic beta 1-2 glucan synthetase [Chitinophagaceae bacterium]
MERFGKTLAGSHTLSTGPAKEHLLRRLADNENILHEVRRLLTESIKTKSQITPAGEWLIDNFYLIEEHIRSAKINFPKGYGEDLPQLFNAGVPGLTRIYDIVLQIISHSDGRIDIESLGAFIKAYQSVTALQMGELWAIPIMMRLALIENLRRVSARIAIDRVDENLAGYWANKMIVTAEKTPKDLILVIADMARSNPPLVSVFVSELTRLLRGRGPDLSLSLNWMERQLLDVGLTSAELINAEIQKQSADQVSISNSIGSLRMLATMDWRNFVEAHSIIEQTLREDNVYGLMDFFTRDHYRHVVEQVAKNSIATENEVARIAIQLTQETNGGNTDERITHVGYFLAGAGLYQTKKMANMHMSFSHKIRHVFQKHILKVYTGFIVLVTLLISTGLVAMAYNQTKNVWLLVSTGILALLCSSQLAVSVVNFFSTLLVKPVMLPKMNYAHGIPPQYRTLVAVPVMLTTENDVENLVEALEVRFLANSTNHLHFALLTDFTDAVLENMPGDETLVHTAQQRIEGLNIKYGRENNDLFFLFHRPRLWNAGEKVWMGYERKRGKLFDLNALLRGGSAERFSVIVGDRSVFPEIKYVITLDADTQLPMGSAVKLIGTMAHPLNRAWYDQKLKRVTKGYGILQPRVSVSLPGTNDSLFTRLHGNEPGIDPYTRTSSDVYQDLFREGSFIGKGIYDVDIFNKVFDDKFPDNSILSHDLLEGCYARSGLVSDVQLFEKYPTGYHADMKRRSRWIRGDWQIFAWFLPFVPGKQKQWIKNPLSPLSRWKIFDNIRRSLVPAALTILQILTWIYFRDALLWTLIVPAIIVFPVFITSMWDTVRKPKDVILLYHIRTSARNIAYVFIVTLLTLVCLPYEAYLNVKAAILSLWRMLLTRRKLLQWDPSAHVENAGQPGPASTYGIMWIEVFLVAAVSAYLFFYAPAKLMIIGPVLALWFIAPLITWRISKPLARRGAILTEDQTIFLRMLARKTWGFFERFFDQDDNWLPPDNYQEEPVAMIAHRTSPTNIGLALLANVSASQFGYITTGHLIERTTRTMYTMQQMERYRGHFYNWYDTRSLNPLLPKYISTVDSGNLAGYLLVLRQGLMAIPNQKILDKKYFTGLLDTLFVLTGTLNDKDKGLLRQLHIDLESAIHAETGAAMIHVHIHNLLNSFNKIAHTLDNDLQTDTGWWLHMFKLQLLQLQTEIKMLMPWILMNTSPFTFDKFNTVDGNSTLMELLRTAKELLVEADHLQAAGPGLTENEWLDLFRPALHETIQMATERLNAVESLAIRCDELADMEWDFLYDSSSHLFSIGYNVQEHFLDSGYYDLLASEAKFGIFVGIAQGKLPEESWFALGRLLTNVEGNTVLLSWSGSMFEYLMPVLVMPTYENTLLHQTTKAAVHWQIEYGKHTGLPWGISESGYNMINAQSHYQYRAFGAPGLGLKRGLEEDSVIAPYASAMALMVAPETACENLELLQEKGFEGRYGFYEAIDYTPSRLPRGQLHAIVYSFMAHHQGMSLLSIAYLLLDQPMQQLFEAEPRFKAALLLLQERIPKATIYFAHTTDIADINYMASGAETRIINTPFTNIPAVQLLSNGNYHVMLTNAGAGYSRWRNIAVTRWREDGTCDNWGTFCYISDLDKKTYWSNTQQPACKKAEKYEAAFSQGRVDFHSTHHELETHTEIVVSPEDDIEMRRVIITNYADVTRTIEVTSYAEVVLAPMASDLIQPGFSNLFVQTAILPDKHAIMCTRRPRSAEDKMPWMFHLMMLQGKAAQEISYETDRMEFIGRGNTTLDPQVMNKPGPLSGRQGSVLDPIVAIRYKIELEPDESITLDMIIGITETQEACKSLLDKYQDEHHKDRVFEVAWTHSQVVLRQINASEADAQLYGRLASSILFNNTAFRADPSVLINNHRQQSGLWSYSISGDLPIVLLKIEKQTNMHLVKQMVQAHAYWSLKGLAVDLVIWNEEQNIYRQSFQNEIQSLIPPEIRDCPGGIFIRVSEQISNEDRILLQSVARVNITDNEKLEDFVKRQPVPKPVIPYIIPVQKYSPLVTVIPLPENLVFFNGSGGFSADGSEYIIRVDNKNRTPAPWVNILANPGFGTIISESGSGYTWMENAHELRLTPWNNDAVSDRGGEAFYLRDEESGHFWSTSFLPTGSDSTYITRHGFGYSVFEHIEAGIFSEMLVYTDLEAAVKFTVIKIRNNSGGPRKLSATGYTEWVLGDNRMKTAMHIHTEIDPDSGALFAKNQYNTEFAGRVAFFDTDGIKKTLTADRAEFIGRNGSLKNPDAMSRIKLSGRVGLALDPCAAIQVSLNLTDGEEKVIIFRLGAGKDPVDACNIVQHFRGTAAAHEAFEKVKKYWKHTLGAIQVETPDAGINFITNGWLTYQTISSRLWGRSGFYQSGGAFGFRDQLQDVMSLLHITPQIARNQLLLCASRQFKEGDVQHWWHPPTGRGVRTRCSDDYLWLPLVTAVYITHTGDTAILEERVHYLEGRLLNPDEESYYDLPTQSVIVSSLYDHCVQAIKNGLKYGEHGLPLIGSGDWNDGYDKVGDKGKGESVWMAFFLYDILIRFEAIARLQDDLLFAESCKFEVIKLKENIDKHAWDGNWYKRAWFDDGKELGTSANEECRIDSIAQSWSVLSGAGNSDRIQTAMESAYKNLVQKDLQIIQLLEPPFDKSDLNPGYIKGYVPGVRENGGQYTHAAVWMIMAFARLGNKERVWELINMINPVNHGKTAAEIAVYKVEPYVLAADVYARVPHGGRGGWTWYTGSAGWMYRLITEFLLGLQQEGDQLKFSPCVPGGWQSFKVHYRYINTMYHIEVIQKSKIEKITVIVDVVEQENLTVTLKDDGNEHEVIVTITGAERV